MLVTTPKPVVIACGVITELEFTVALGVDG
jgi:hypothetical protein